MSVKHFHRKKIFPIRSRLCLVEHLGTLTAFQPGLIWISITVISFFLFKRNIHFPPIRRTENFFYNWSELAYQPLNWIYGGVSVQHTHLYNTETVLSQGFLVGFCFQKSYDSIVHFCTIQEKQVFYAWTNGRVGTDQRKTSSVTGIRRSLTEQ